MAATNALFWTERGWDGSEAMVDKSLPHCVYLPEHTRITLFSREMIKTIIVTLQGIQAIILLTGFLSTSSTNTFNPFMAVDIIFFPLACIGLLRLCSSFWLSDDFAYSADNVPQLTGLGGRRLSLDSLLDCPSSALPSRFRKTSFWPSRLFRIIFYLPILGICVMAILFMFNGGEFTATVFVAVVFYILWLTATGVIFSYYFVRGHTTTTVIPCITSAWYKVYTGIIMGLAVVLIIISCIETRVTPCGKYTSGPGIDADIIACLMTSPVVLGPGPDFLFFGLVAHNFEEFGNGSVSIIPGKQHEYNFTGYYRLLQVMIIGYSYRLLQAITGYYRLLQVMVTSYYRLLQVIITGYYRLLQALQATTGLRAAGFTCYPYMTVRDHIPHNHKNFTADSLVLVSREMGNSQSALTIEETSGEEKPDLYPFFPRFNEFPFEIRAKIWELTIEPRIVGIIPYQIKPRCWSIKSIIRPPGAMHTCREARNIVAPHYYPLEVAVASKGEINQLSDFAVIDAEPLILFNFSLDTIHFVDINPPNKPIPSEGEAIKKKPTIATNALDLLILKEGENIFGPGMMRWVQTNFRIMEWSYIFEGKQTWDSPVKGGDPLLRTGHLITHPPHSSDFDNSRTMVQRLREDGAVVFPDTHSAPDMKANLFEVVDAPIDDVILEKWCQFSREMLRNNTVAAQPSQPLVDDWVIESANWTADQLVFVDESASNERTGDRKYGWVPEWCIRIAGELRDPSKAEFLDRQILSDIAQPTSRRHSFFQIRFPGNKPVAYSGLQDYALSTFIRFRRDNRMGKGGGGLMEKLLEEQAILGKESFSDLDIAAKYADHLDAGTKTTSDILPFGLWVLSLPCHIHFQQRLALEVKFLKESTLSLMDEQGISVPPVDLCDRLPFLDAVSKELLRLYAPIPESQPRTSMYDATIDGYLVPAGTVVSCQAYSLHRNPNVFYYPHQFSSDRWQGSEDDITEMNRWWWPFSSGGRMCIGIQDKDVISSFTNVKPSRLLKVTRETGGDNFNPYINLPYMET
ncbi:hypothetical protein B7463_g4748, partial [Scytalidium lignicola]